MQWFKGKLISLLIFSQKLFNDEQREAMTDKVLKQLYLHNDEEKQKIDKMVFLCEPNAGRFEFHDMESHMVDAFLDNGYNVVLWNYAGYNHNDSFKCSLDVKLSEC